MQRRDIAYAMRRRGYGRGVALCMASGHEKNMASSGEHSAWNGASLQGSIAGRGLASAGTPSNWSTWWIMDGSDDADCLRHADVKAKMNDQLMDVMRDYQTEN